MPNSRSVEMSTDMGHVVGQERSSGQRQNVVAVREKTPLPWVDKAMLLRGKHRVRHSFSQPSDDQGFNFTENASAEKVQSRSAGNERKRRVGGRAFDDYELVKHMSNLPGFLQHVEKDNTIQDKALNFGVLDWKRLEKWKYTERMPGKLLRKASPTSDSFVSASGLPKISPNLKRQPSSHTRYPSLSHLGKQPVADGSSSQQQQPPKSLCIKSSKEERNGKYQKEEEYVEYLKSKGKERCNQKYHTAESIRIVRQQNHSKQTGKYSDQYSTETIAYKSRMNPQKEIVSEREASSSSSKQRKQKVAPLPPNKVGAYGKKSERRYDELKLTSGRSAPEPQNIVLLVPKDLQEKGRSESSQLTECRTSLDTKLSAIEVTGNRLSDFCSPRELYSGGYSDIPHSCPLPSSSMKPHDLLASHATDAEIFPNADSITSTSSEAKFSDMSEEAIRASAYIEPSSRKQGINGEQSTAKGRSPSPTRRFSFNLGKMGRSFSFKESSAVPQLSSTYTPVKSAPVRSEVSHSMDSVDKDLANSKARSSPLRRLLDPLLKQKSSSDTVRPLNGSLRSMTAGPTGIKGPPQDKRPDASNFQALLQLTFKNGLPFFRLVVENRKDMLAAAVKRLPASEKNDPCMVYSFYTVHEIKKKSMNWINHGSKSKSCSLGYSIIGQMKISTIYHLKANREDTSDCDARECVLYGVDPGQVDKQMLAFVPKKEIAAIVVKNSSKRVNGGEFMDKNHQSEGRNFPWLVFPASSESQEKANANGTIVILPGAVHGIPIKGTPSSLISRWRSGGCCDCGGWDVGCKLRILADSRKSSNNTQESASSSADHVNLFMQGGEHKGGPVFSLKPFSDEFYSIEMDPSISLLEAFATSVAHLTCRKIPEIIDYKGQSEAEHVPDPNPRADRRKPPLFQEQVPAKYITCPPLSPVGRI
ncbi:hypothetical protein SASPL_102049 [Salvia splendens]|uniref:Uncharacterized protein n=1 Tax=Salvia splendens TaxID=180675 RepID=A0A8X8YQF3_SALSN|nr:uncharacterized protein LOC121747305 [Salvia splendens]XP_041997264.1 uncharacterized protein LOC121747305 [Salvia splendens]KAG6437138.1 hypothetical protein SASPL_102049 [Salvia splendens]